MLEKGCLGKGNLGRNKQAADRRSCESARYGERQGQLYWMAWMASTSSSPVVAEVSH